MATAVLGSMADNDVILDAWYSMLGYIPFGNKLAPFCIDLFSESFGLGKGMAEYLNGIKSGTTIELFEDMMKLILTAVFFEAVNNILLVIMQVKEHEGIYGKLMEMMIGMVSSLICTFIASLVLHFFCQQLNSLPVIAQKIMSTLVTSITVSGALGVVYFAFGKKLISACIYTVIKIIMLNVFKVVTTYIGILLILLFIGEKEYLRVGAVGAGWIVIIVALIGLDLMVSSVFE